ncbi:cytochrome P450 [Archangium lansingense]|uniref:Cytochrome P450 n=1 Tax=Archangium lansingense TaxID=2995310 RepID=A0ABT3ZZU7_9BACT|nr:cytochrome P450 [Archangium lansinium]MCY1074928.1 cytochrome P450 [Archangium lansinium]
MGSAGQKTDLDPVSLENLLNPHSLYPELRERAPVYWSAGMHAWVITRYDDVLSCYRDPRLSADRSGFYQQQLAGFGPEFAEGFLSVARRQMTMRDGSDHIRVRRQTSPGFTPQRLDAYRPAIRFIMGAMLDRVQPLGRMDLVQELSYQLPPRVIAEFLNIPQQDRERFQQLARPQAEFSNPSPGADMGEVARNASRSMTELSAYLGGIIEERRSHPGEDMLSLMIHAQELGQMTHEDLVANAILILTAGHLTTTDQISNGVHDLLTHPDQLLLLQKDRTLLKSAVEEMLRFSPSVPYNFRIAKEDIPLRGQTIGKGSTVFMSLASANRDPAVFTEPERFDITRDHLHQKHLTFGFGSHHCLGAGLARRELEISIEMLLDRLPDLRLDETKPPQVKPGIIIRSITSLNVQW